MRSHERAVISFWEALILGEAAKHSVKLALADKAKDRGTEVVGLHSVVVLDDDTVDCIFDISPDDSGCGLHFRFKRPASVEKEDVREFGLWLAASEVTVH